MASIRPTARRRKDTIDRTIRFWPVFALFPIIVVGQVKATGFVSLGGVDTTVLSIVLLLAITIVTLLRHPRYPVRQMLPYFIFALVVLVAVSMSDPGDYQSQKARDFFLLTGVIVCCIPVLLRDVRDLRGLIAVWFSGGFLVASLVLILGGAADLYGRAGIGEATLGPAYLSAAALVVGGAAVGEKLLPLTVALPGMAVSGIALVTIGSRGPIVGAAVGLVAWILVRGVLRARSLMVLMVVVAVAWAGVRQASEVALSRLTIEDPGREGLWATARMIFIDHPYLGVGWGDYSTVSGLKYPHNLFLEAAAELGVLGLVCILALLVIACARVWRSRSAPEVRVIASVAIVMLVGQQFSSDLTNRLFWVAIIPCLLLPVRGGSPEAASPTNVRRSRGRPTARPRVAVAPRLVDPQPARRQSKSRT